MRNAVKCLEERRQQKHILFPFSATMMRHTHSYSYSYRTHSHKKDTHPQDTVGMACLNMQFQFPKNTKRVQHAEGFAAQDSDWAWAEDGWAQGFEGCKI